MTTHLHRTVSVTTGFGSLSAGVLGEPAGDVGPSGDVVVVWPSVLSTAAVQQRLIDGLVPQFIVVAVDPPGHGRSRIENPSGLSMVACARATFALVDAAVADRETRGERPGIRWVGTSWGGLVGIEAARMAPTRMRHLACLNTPFAFSPPTPLRPAWLPGMARLVGTSGLYATMTARSFYLPATRHDASRSAEMAAHRDTFRNGERGQLAAALRLLFIDREDARASLPQVTTPTLVIAGAHDGMYSPSSQQEAARLLRNGSYEVVESAHIAAVDATSDVLEALDRHWRAATLPRDDAT